MFNLTHTFVVWYWFCTLIWGLETYWPEGNEIRLHGFVSATLIASCSSVSQQVSIQVTQEKISNSDTPSFGNVGHIWTSSLLDGKFLATAKLSLPVGSKGSINCFKTIVLSPNSSQTEILQTWSYAVKGIIIHFGVNHVLKTV